TLVEKYGQVKEFLGDGASGEVRLAHKADTKELFVVKRYRSRKPLYYALHRYNLDYVWNEWAMSWNLNHHNILRSLDLMRHSNNCLCLVMEFCGAGSLYEYVFRDNPEKSPLVQDEPDCFFVQMMHGLRYLHGMGVTHGDMGLGNLLLNERGCIKICDFGLAKPCRKVRITENIHIVPAAAQLMPPQLLNCKQELFRLESIDIWAAGVLYVLMRTGDYLWKRPREDDKDYARYLEERKMTALLSWMYSLTDLRQRDCASVLNGMLDPDADQRLIANEVLNSAWLMSVHVCLAGMGL
ncbi:kinase-like protein, partial [Cadophora sp. DSE1049]